jgi:hypothetical protein
MTAKEGTAMPTIALSESAVAVLRFRVKGWRFPIRDRDRDAFRELIAAGIMTPVTGADGTPEVDYRFTEEGWVRRQELLHEAEERIERERYDPPDASDLSEAAKGLLRRILSGERVEVTNENRDTFRELAAARIVMLMHSFAKGDESDYKFTYWGWKRRFEWIGVAPPGDTLLNATSTPSPSPSQSPSPGR